MEVNNVAAIVTGGASGLGGATAAMLAKRGAKVTIFDVNEELGKSRVRPGIVGAGHRVCRHKMHVIRQVGRHVAHYLGLDGADVGEDCAALRGVDLVGDHVEPLMQSGPERDELGQRR